MAAFSTCVCWLPAPSTARKVSRHPRLRLSTAHHEWNHQILALVAMEKGYFAEEGLDDIEVIAFPEDEAAQIEALTNGLVDIALDPMTHRVLAAHDQGADIYIVGPRRKVHNFVIIGQKWMKSIKDLRDRELHIIAEGEPTQQLKQILKMNGLEWGKDVDIIHKTSKMHDLLRLEKDFLAGESLTFNAHPWDAERWVEKGYPILADTTKLFPPRQDRIVAATGELVNEKPETLKAFLKAYIKASRFLVNGKNVDAIRVVVDKAGFFSSDADRENFPVVIGHVANRIAEDGTLSIEGVMQSIKEQREAGNITERITLDRVLRIGPLRQAQKELGIEPGQNP